AGGAGVVAVDLARVSIFVFQAEDGMRDFHVTGVQTCALPISAISGVLMRLVVISGICTSPLSLAVTLVKAARGTLVAMVGMRASCQPIPVLMMVAPAASMALARVTISSQTLPPSIKSSIDRR